MTVNKPKISNRNPDWNDYVPTEGDRVVVTRIAYKDLRPILGESATIQKIDNTMHDKTAFISLVMDKQISGKKIHSVWDDEVLMQKVDGNDQ